MPKRVSQAFVSSILYGVNKGLSVILTTEGGKAICRYIARGMFEFLVNRGIAKRDMSIKELEKLLVDKLGLAENVEIQDSGDKLSVKVYSPTLTDFLEEMMKNRVPLILCPLIAVLIEVYHTKGVKLNLENALPRDYGIELVFSKEE